MISYSDTAVAVVTEKQQLNAMSVKNLIKILTGNYSFPFLLYAVLITIECENSCNPEYYKL